MIVVGLSLTLPMLNSCVDDEYDLSKDIDMTVTVGGGELTLPASNTAPVFLSTIFDLEPGSSIITVDNDGDYGLVAGDYALVQNGDTRHADIKIDPVVFHNNKDGHTTIELPVQLPTLPDGEEFDYDHLLVSDVEIVSDFEVSDDNVTTEVLSISEAETIVDIDVRYGYDTTSDIPEVIFKKGYQTIFDESLTLTVEDDKYCIVKDGHILEFTRDHVIKKGESLHVEVIGHHIDFDKVPEGQGLYAPGKFYYDSEVKTIGDIEISHIHLSSGERMHIEVFSNYHVVRAELLSVTGRFDPKVTVDPTTIRINDIPDFLSEEGTTLNLYNPQIYLSTSNSSPAEVSINAMITAYDNDGTKRSVGIGEKYGTDPVLLGTGQTEICLSTQGVGAPEGGINVKVADLSSIIETVPDRIELHDIEAKLVDKEYTILLGQEYNVSLDYDVVAPLCFGAGLNIFYSEIEDGLSGDLDDVDVNEVVVSLTAVNTIPLDMTLEAFAVDIHGNEISGINTVVDGVIAAGHLENEVESPVTITLTATKGSLSKLDGVKARFHATSSAAATNDQLNANQSIAFEDVVLSIKGGATVDLN